MAMLGVYKTDLAGVSGLQLAALVAFLGACTIQPPEQILRDGFGFDPGLAPIVEPLEGTCDAEVLRAGDSDRLLPGNWHINLSSVPLFDPMFRCPVSTCNQRNFPDDLYYTTNPPSSGPHYASMWATYGEHPIPIDPRFYVHNLEHGSVLFFYRCNSAAQCPNAAVTLDSISNALPDDPDCLRRRRGVRKQVITAPNPDMDVQVAVVSWGWTFKASCINREQILEFANARYKAYDAEPVCIQGLTDEEMACRLGGGSRAECQDR